MTGGGVEAVVSGLDEARHRLESSRSSLATAGALAEELLERCRSLDLDGLAVQAEQMLDRFADLAQQVERTEFVASELVAKAGALGDAGSSARAVSNAPAAGETAIGQAQIPGPISSVSPESAKAVPTGWRWTPALEAPQAIQKAGGDFIPRPTGVNRPTVGVFAGDQVESGGKDRDLASDLVHDPLRGPPVTFYQHVESKVAARMRREGIAEGDLALDNTVCGSNERDRDQVWSCERILPSILPAGARLTVWVTRDGGRTWWVAEYLGTGERIVR